VLLLPSENSLFRRDLPENIAFSQHKFASLNFAMSVSEYVTINVTVKPVKFLREQVIAVLWFLTRAAVKLSWFHNNYSSKIRLFFTIVGKN